MKAGVGWERWIGGAKREGGVLFLGEWRRGWIVGKDYLLGRASTLHDRTEFQIEEYSFVFLNMCGCEKWASKRGGTKHFNWKHQLYFGWLLENEWEIKFFPSIRFEMFCFIFFLFIFFWYSTITLVLSSHSLSPHTFLVLHLYFFVLFCFVYCDVLCNCHSNVAMA